MFFLVFKSLYWISYPGENGRDILKNMVTKECTNQEVPIVKKQLQNRTTDRTVRAQNTPKRFCQVSYTHWEIMVVAGGGLNKRSWSEFLTVFRYRVCTILFTLLSEGVLLLRQLLCETMKHPLLEKSLALTYSSRSVIW